MSALLFSSRSKIECTQNLKFSANVSKFVGLLLKVARVLNIFLTRKLLKNMPMLPRSALVREKLNFPNNRKRGIVYDFQLKQIQICKGLKVCTFAGKSSKKGFLMKKFSIRKTY